MLVDVALLALTIAAIAPYTVGPILVRFVQRWPARPPFEPYDPIRHPLPDDLAASFRESVDGLLRAGFQLLADLAHVSPITKIQLRVALLHDAAPAGGGGRRGGEHALVVGARSTNPKAKMAACYVEFATKFADGTALSVNNNTEPEAYAPAPTRVVERFPQVRDLARLLRVHRALLERHYARRARVPVDPAGDPASFVSDALAREYQLQVGTGYFWLDERAQVYRPTWFGAWAMSFRLLPPMRQILEARRRRRAAALLAALGLAGPGERPIPAPASADPLRWNLALLIAAVLLYLFAREPLRGTSPRAGPPRERFDVPADFTVPADFRGAVRVLERLAGESAAPLVGGDANGDPRPTPGVAVGVAAARAEALLDAVQEHFLARGFYLFRAERHFGLGQPDRLALFPRRDPYEIVGLMGTNGWNYDVGPDSVIAWLRALHGDHPFVLRGIGFDWVEGRFLGEIQHADSLARRFYAFCPDVVDQGAGSVRALARELRDSRTLYCWWD